MYNPYFNHMSYILLILIHEQLFDDDEHVKKIIGRKWVFLKS